MNERHVIYFLFRFFYNKLQKCITRAPHVVPTLICWGGHHSTKKFKLKNSFQSYAPCPDEQVFQVWCRYLE